VEGREEMETTDDFVEVELPDNEYFHEGVVGLAMDIVADCKMVVETVNGINTEMDPDTTDTTDAIKETFVQAIKRVPQSAARLVDMTHQFIRENAAFYLDDHQYLVLVLLLPPLPPPPNSDEAAVVNAPNTLFLIISFDILSSFPF
jgi:hypothetical protein